MDTSAKAITITPEQATKVTEWLVTNVVESNANDNKDYAELATLASAELAIGINKWNVNGLMMARARRIEFGGRDMPPTTA